MGTQNPQRTMSAAAALLARAGPALPDASNSTVFQSLTLASDNQNGSTLSLSQCGRFAALGNRYGLALVDLEAPFDAPKLLQQQQNLKFDASVLEFSPHAQNRDCIISSFNQAILIWRVDSGGVSATLQSAHSRAVSDISFSHHDANAFASTSPDQHIKFWDLRAPTPTFAMRAKGPVAALKFSKCDENLIASAQTNEVSVFDIRVRSSIS